MSRIKYLWFSVMLLTLLTLSGCQKEAVEKSGDKILDESNVENTTEIAPIAVVVKHPIVQPMAPVEPEPAIHVEDCAVVDLEQPNSPRESVRVRQDKGNITIEVRGDNACLKLTGTHKGSVTVSTNSDHPLGVILENAHILGSERSGFLKLKLNDKDHKDEHVFILRLEGENTIEGGYTNDSKQVLECKSSLDIVGTGTLHVTAHYKTAIDVDDVLRVYHGSIYANVDRSEKTIWKMLDSNTPDLEKGFGIKAGNAFEMLGGALVVTAKDTLIPDNCEARGIKVDGVESAYGAGKGYIKIKGGDLFVQSDAKALSAGWDIEEDAKTNSTDDDPVPDLYISGGRVRISTFAQPRDEMWTDNTLSPEGIEGKNSVYISGGEIIVKATDDAINAGHSIYLSGGKVVAWSSDNDAIDGNKAVVISGGTIVALGASEPEGGIDADASRNVIYMGGVAVAIGGDNNSPAGTGTTGSFVQSGTERKGPGGRGFGMPPGPPPHMDGHGGPGFGMPPGPPTGMDGVRGHGGKDDKGMPGEHEHGGMKGPGGMGRPGNRPKTLSDFASKTLALTKKDDSEVIAAIQLPENYSGGTNVLVLHPSIEKGAEYVLYTDAKVKEGDSDRHYDFGDGLRLLLSGTATGTDKKDVKGGEAVGGMGPGVMSWPMNIFIGVMMQFMPRPEHPGKGGKNRMKTHKAQ